VASKKSMVRVLFVCMGNICRSPMAEGVVRALAERAGLSSALEVDSAGTHAYHEGEHPDQRARKIAARRGYELSNLRARRVRDQDFSRFDQILAMDRQNLEFLRRLCPPEHVSKLGLFLNYAHGLAQDEVADPYYGGAEGFENVLDLCEQAARGLIEAIAQSASVSKADRR
jgi:protein-tyrosine phosphatase